MKNAIYFKWRKKNMLYFIRDCQLRIQYNYYKNRFQNDLFIVKINIRFKFEVAIVEKNKRQNSIQFRSNK
jgi:hypothetical protein